MEQSFDAIIVGAGVIGSSIAYNLSKRGNKVLVLEKGQVAGKASSAAAGMLGAQTELEDNSPLFRLAKASRLMFPDLAEDLKQLSGIDIELQQNGIYKVATAEREVSKLQRLIRIQNELGEEAYWVTPTELRDQEPALSLLTFGAMYMPNDGQVSAPALTTALATSAVALGAEILEHTGVEQLLEKDGRVVGVKTAVRQFYADNVIVAGGAWSEALLKEAAVTLETYPVKGECMSVKTTTRVVNGTIFSDGCYIVPKADNRLIIGATEKADTFDETVTLEGIAKLMECAMHIIPELKRAEWDSAWAGIRPQTMDGVPYLGEHQGKKGLYIATGHYRNGILLAPITGKVIADLIDGVEMDSEWKSAFQINRKTGVDLS
ncbi:glycine oxidase ThiO [Pseudalkalibacillus berkeleyi]|uniref:glycine oxidase n=1 Tax=Pseudalkalibacillus berkeleyi TaxID=1069813 RepID=A0ABS9H581_9BACL|nr:glycine oxidase ThiO [Pseudalkalibacillus berkeleyi]MCF6139241.1 glycine oxidase ThiO [Pseudalkalibacillus berkeleyi]